MANIVTAIFARGATRLAAVVVNNYAALFAVAGKT
jgi:hypothetical protein